MRRRITVWQPLRRLRSSHMPAPFMLVSCLPAPAPQVQCAPLVRCHALLLALRELYLLQSPPAGCSSAPCPSAPNEACLTAMGLPRALGLEHTHLRNHSPAQISAPELGLFAPRPPLKLLTAMRRWRQADGRLRALVCPRRRGRAHSRRGSAELRMCENVFESFSRHDSVHRAVITSSNQACSCNASCATIVDFVCQCAAVGPSNVFHLAIAPRRRVLWLCMRLPA